MRWRQIAEQLDAAAEKTGKSCEDLARETGIPGIMISRYMCGNVEKIPIDRMQRICMALGLDIDEVIDWEQLGGENYGSI